MRPHSATSPSPVRFQPRLTLQTLTRGDGVLGMRAHGLFGPRGGMVTVAQIDWVYGEGASRWSMPAPVRFEDEGGAGYTPAHVVRDVAAETAALELIRELGFLPLREDALQWRAHNPLHDAGPLWTLVQEAAFGDFWADQAPRLQQLGWQLVVRPGFAHESVPVTAWRFIVSSETGEVLGKEVAAPLQPRAFSSEVFDGLDPSGRWLLSIGIEVDGETMDVGPMVADLLRRDPRWADAQQVEKMDDHAVISLRAPGGRRIDAMAGPLKAVVLALLDLLGDLKRKDGPLKLTPWDAHRLDAIHAALLDLDGGTPWHMSGEAGVLQLARRLREAGAVPRLGSIDAPQGLGIALRGYQLQGVAWLQYLREQGLAGILADDMGLGKTAQVLAHMLIEQQAGRLDLPALVVVPTSLLFNWQQEAQRIAPALRVLALHGEGRARHIEAIGNGAADLVLTTYPLLWRDLGELARLRFHLLVLDEAQTVKNAASRSATAARKLYARHRICMTGTPLENHLGELWTQFHFLMPGFLGDARSFSRLWRKPIEEQGQTVRARLLAQRVRPFILRRRKEDVLQELPPRTEIIERLQLQGRQRELYESVRIAADKQVRRALQRRGLTGSQVTVMDALLKLRQVCCDPYLLKDGRMPRGIERAKIELLRDMLPALVAEGRRILVFSQFTAMLALIEAELRELGLPWLSLTGDTEPAARGAVIAQFQARQAPLFLISLKAGGVGLNLTAADTVVLVDPWWNPAVEEQAIARAHRLGQTQQVFVYKLVVEGSIEERLLELQARKSALAEGVLGRDDAQAVKFGEEELQALLAPLGMGIREKVAEIPARSLTADVWDGVS
ncbi:DEAD/DEAH box helicase [Herbaspirillum sp. SJZ099]|uniref:DEAD/DEAH box helicase n=1 Tax=Herbaspirillum sp. SJZ099 TaxID=2572916 RepID=UPI0011A4DA37|nr:DEAD/DEAH box helicase [Herbaspirillum sp. SJZ099]TWC69529.1 helicase-like protein [Herbaspirillum sp. SJZ099]